MANRKSSRGLLGTIFSLLKGDTQEEIPSVCDGWCCSSHLVVMRTGIHKVLRKAEQENGKNVSFCLHLHAFELNSLIRLNYEFSFPFFSFPFYVSEGDSDG